MAGLTSEGFVPKTLEEILTSLETKQKAEIDPLLDVDSESPIGQLNGIFARELALIWELVEAVYDAADPEKAVGAALTAITKLSGTIRRAASYTIVGASVDLDAGTTLESGTHFAEVDGDPESRWTPVEDYTAESSGVQTVNFRAESTGPTALTQNTLTVIATSVSGWNSINNPTSATVGRVLDTDATLLSRHDESVAATGSATTQAIRADVLAAHEDILDVTVFTNRTDDTDGDGVPPHAVEVVVFDGVTPAVTNDVIAQAIYDSVGAGTAIHGTSSGTAVDPDSGESVTVAFTRPSVLEAYVDLTVTEEEGATVTASELESYIATEAAKLITSSGQRAYWRQIDNIAFNFAGVEAVTAFYMGSSPSPVTAADVPPTTRQIVNFDAANISVTVS